MSNHVPVSKLPLYLQTLGPMKLLFFTRENDHLLPVISICPSFSQLTLLFTLETQERELIRVCSQMSTKQLLDP